MSSRIHVGVGGWSFDGWRGAFYPDALPKANELAFMAERMTALEINATFYRTQTPATFQKWAAVTPAGFKFALKAQRAATYGGSLAASGDAIERFLASGLTELGDKLGPILWQLRATKRFDRDEIAAFLKLLPAQHAGIPLRHVIEAGHESFADPAFVTLLREAKADVGQVILDDPDHRMIADVTGDFVYLRLERSRDIATGYPKPELDAWASRLKSYAAGRVPEDLPTLPGDAPKAKQRDVFAFFIAGEKARNPAAAMAMIERL